MKQLTVGLLLIVLAVMPVTADTKTGSANRNNVQNWRFTPFTDGQIQVVLSWTNSGAKLIMILVCGQNDPQTFGVSAGGLNRVATLEVGLISGQTCQLGVTSLQGSSGYRIHFNHASSISSSAAGRIALVLPADERDAGTLLTDTVERVRVAVQRQWDRSR